MRICAAVWGIPAPVVGDDEDDDDINLYLYLYPNDPLRGLTQLLAVWATMLIPMRMPLALSCRLFLPLFLVANF
jgi:hypothetical protein